VYQLKTRIFERAMRMRLGVLIKSEKSSANTETGEDGRAVPAAAKGAIDVGAVFADLETGKGFFDKDRDMADLTHGVERRRHLGPLLRSSLEAAGFPGSFAASQ
jgi:hypothetical protein